MFLQASDHNISVKQWIYNLVWCMLLLKHTWFNIYIVDLLTLNSWPKHYNSHQNEAHLSHVFSLGGTLHSSCVRNTRGHFNTAPGGHFKQKSPLQNTKHKQTNHSVALKDCKKDHLFTLWGVKQEDPALPCSISAGNVYVFGDSDFSLPCAHL